MKTRFVITVLFSTLFLPAVLFAQVADTTPPIIIAPATQSFVATTTPATPTLVLATATDDIDSNPVITYSPQSFDFGTTTVVWTATDVSGNFSTTTSDVLIMPAADTIPPEIAHILIRDGETLVGPFEVDLSIIQATSTIEISATSATSTHSIPARSLLALVSLLDTTHDEFSINTLQYYDSFGAFYLKCITVPMATSTPECDNWTYTVNGTSPWSGMDSYVLQNGDTAYLFFGPKRLAIVSTSTITVNTPFTVTAKSYNPVYNSYLSLSGITIGITQPDPANPWSPIEVATSTVNENGEAVFTLSTAGSYDIGIKEDYYSPVTTLTVTEVVAPETPAPSSGGGGSYAPATVSFDTARAFAYLSSQQSSDGSFGSDMITDWVTIAFANAGAPLEAKEKLRAYLLSAVPTLTSATDYERHAMALEALGINPYTGTSVDYIKKITDSFDGTQMGDTGEVNDDIFSLFPLLHAGYGVNEEMIKKIVAFIIARQEGDGSWGSVDMTSAGVQALVLVSGQDGVSNALAKAKSYLQSKQENDGGFGNSFSTSWVMQAIASFGESSSSWMKNGRTPADYFASLQQADGGLDVTTLDMQSRIWATAYGVPASLQKSWDALMGTFARPVVIVASGGNNGGASTFESQTVVTTTPTSTLATTTPEKINPIIATTTVPVLTQKIAKKVVTPRTEIQKIKPVVVASVSTSTNQQASVPENKGSIAITHFFSSVWGGVGAFIKWLF